MSDNNPKIDILLATYNGERFLSEQIDSILNQTYANWNLIIRDDGSTDNTLVIINDYIDKYPEKIKFIKDDKKNLGSSKNFSELLSHTESKYIMFCDQDDVWLPKKNELSVNEILKLEKRYRNNVPLLVFSDLFVVDENINIVSDSFWKLKKRDPQNTALNRLILQNVITGCTTIMNRRLIELSLPIDEKAMMHDWWIAIVASAFGEISFIDRPLVKYRQHGSNVIGANTKSVSKFLKKISTGKFDKAIFIDHMQRVFAQADSFFRVYKEKLPEDKLAITEMFVSLNRNGFWEKRYYIFKHNYYCNSVIDNLELIIRL